MGSRVSYVLFTVVLAGSFASCARAAIRDEGDAVMAALTTLEAFDDWVLQGALRVKYVRGKLGNLTLPGRESLEHLVGITGVTIKISADLKGTGLIEEAVKASVELKLRQNGISISAPPDDPAEFRMWMISHPENVFNRQGLIVSMESISLSQRGITAVNVTVFQNQLVNLLGRQRPAIMFVSTWEQGQHLICGRQQVAQRCREALNDLLDMYCNDWLATHSPQRTELPHDPNSQNREENDN